MTANHGITPQDPSGQDRTGDFDDVDFGMHTPDGNAALAKLCEDVEAAFKAGLGRAVALQVLHGGLFDLEVDGEHAEWSDTVVRGMLAYVLDPVCAAHDVAPFTDQEINQVALEMVTRAVNGLTSGFAQGYTAREA